MQYLIEDLQTPGRYFGEEALFESKKDACEQLISFHSVDNDMSVEQYLLDNNKIDKCWTLLLADFDWRLVEVCCPKCGGKISEELEIDDYPWQCKKCDENFYTFEIIK